MRPKTSLTLVAATIALAAPAVGGAQGDDPEKVKTKVNLQKVDFSEGKASGTLKSEKKFCLKKRTVSLVEVTDYGQEKVKSALTGRDGKFVIKAPIIEIWQYKVTAKRKTVINGGKKYICKGGVSRLVVPS